MLRKIAEFVKINQCTLFALLIVSANIGFFIAGIILLKMGRGLPSGELYQCNKEAFQLVVDEADPAEFYRKLQSQCDRLSSCAANLTAIIMTALCEKPCESLFVTADTADATVVRICSGNTDIGAGTMMVVWGGAGLLCLLLSAVFCCHALVSPLVRMRESYREIFFAPSCDRQNTHETLQIPIFDNG
jgi:hypothetical protein